VLAMIGIAAIPGVAGALVPSGTGSVHVSIRPASGSPTTHFAVSFKAALSTGIIGDTGATYRVTASATAHAGCQASIAVVGPPTHVGAMVRVKLTPNAHTRWCAGTFHGQVWKSVFPRCPAGRACPALVFPPLKVGTFSFRVTHS
jgi:hypothetical protein